MPTTSVSVEAVRQQLENLGRRDVPEDLIASFLRDLGVKPDLSAGAAPSAHREGEGEYEEDFEREGEEEEFLGCSRVDEREARAPLGVSRAANTPPRGEHLHRYGHGLAGEGMAKENASPDDALLSYRSESRMSGERSWSPSPSKKSRAGALAGGAPKTDRVARYQQTRDSWKSNCKAVQNGKKSKPAINFHKLHQQQHAQAAKKTKRAIASGRKKVVRGPAYTTVNEQRRDSLRFEVRQSLRHVSE